MIFGRGAIAADVDKNEFRAYPSPDAKKSLTLAANGKSDFVIFHEDNAPATVADAALELQRVIKAATGAELKIVRAPAAPMIALGDNAASRAAGINASMLKPEGFAIMTKGGTIYIAGSDTTPKHMRYDPWQSAGTWHGTCDFLERFVGARWLLPLAEGEIIPRHESLALPELNYSDAPDFACRELFSRPVNELKSWMLHNRVYYRSHWVYASHVWNMIPSPDVLARHPEYVAQTGGVRAKPSGDFYKLCTTDEGLIKAFADGIIGVFDKDPARPEFSISPTDGGGWCECEKCVALDENVVDWPGYREWQGNKARSLTKRILTFYNAVAKCVAEKYPDKQLQGYVYYNYGLPTRESFPIAKNLFLVLAPAQYYGCNLYRADQMAEFPKLVREWCKRYPGQMGYYDLPSMFCGDLIGAPLPPAASILKKMFPALKEGGMRSVLIYDVPGWGHGGLHNYLVSKLMWNADADVEAVMNDFLTHAYGEAAGKTMRVLYRKLENWVGDYKRGNVNDFAWLLHTPMAEAIWAKHYREIERDYAQALAQVETAPRKIRLGYFGLCMQVLNYHLRKADMLPQPETSMFYLDDAKFEEFAKLNYKTLAVETDPKAKDYKEFMRPRLWRKETRAAAVPRLRGAAPQIDGELSDEAWKYAAVIKDFRRYQAHDLARAQTEARIMFDNDTLYLAFRCAENDMKALRASMPSGKRDDGAIYENDGVEFFLGPEQDAGDVAVGVVKHAYWHITANPNGALWDDFCCAIGENADMRVKTKRGDNFWTVEMAIAIKSLKLGKLSGKTWAGNFARERPRADWDSSENSCWNAVEQGFCDPNMFGKFSFAK